MVGGCFAGIRDALILLREKLIWVTQFGQFQNGSFSKSKNLIEFFQLPYRNHVYIVEDEADGLVGDAVGKVIKLFFFVLRK